MSKPNSITTGELNELINCGVAVGCVDRAANAVSPEFAQRYQSDATRLRLATRVRVASVLGDIAEKVQHAVAATGNETLSVRVPVMVLTHAEYPGPEKRSSYNMPVATLTRDKLQQAAKIVFDALVDGLRNPELDYVYDGMTRTSTLQILITVVAPNREMKPFDAAPGSANG
jgi:hypothetical protein